MPTLTVAQLAALCGVDSSDDNRQISGVNTLDEAGETDLAFIDNERLFAAAEKSNAGCLIAPLAFDLAGSWTVLRTNDPRSAFAKAAAAVLPEPEPQPLVHPMAIIDPSARIGANCHIGAYATIGPRVQIEDRCVISSGCRLAEDVTIGAGTILHPNVTVYRRTKIGARVIIHAGTVIGADGFGYTFSGRKFEKFPQTGAVLIEDDVEIGANCCIDRAAIGFTRIGAGTKLDNLIHIAHNCTIGKHVVMAAQAGLSGSVTVGDYSMVGGQTGIGEKAVLAPKSVVGGKAGILTGQRIEAGEPVWGIPARPLRQHLKNLANVSKLPQLIERIKKLEQK